MKKRNNSKGITLVALIVTVIVLIILASISISAITGNNSLVDKAVNSKDNYEIAEEKELIDKCVTYAKGKEKYGNLKADDLEEELETYAQGKTEVTEEDGKIKVTFTDSGRSYLIDIDGNVTEVSIVDRTGINVGDYINYTPDVDTNTVYSHTTLDTYSGDNNISIGDIVQDNLNWQVLRIYDNGSIDLIGNQTSQFIHFDGILGYTNGVYLMDDICKKLYSRNENNIIARSVDLEDFEYWLNKSEEGITSRNSNIKNSYTYGDSITYTGNKNKYPPFYKTQLSESDVGTLSTNTNYETDGDLTIKQTFYSIDINNANFSDGYKVLKEGSNYWIASRFAYNISGNYAGFGLRRKESNKINGMYLYYSSGTSSPLRLFATSSSFEKQRSNNFNFRDNK